MVRKIDIKAHKYLYVCIFLYRIYIMPKSHKKTNSRRRNKSQKRRHTRRRASSNLGGYIFTAGSCGCGGQSPLTQSNVMPATPGILKGGNVQPSFSNLPTSKFYPLNEYQTDPNTMSVNSRLLPNIPIGMSSMRGGKSRRRKQRGQKKIKGGISIGGLLSHASSVVMGNGLSDNIVANQGGIGGMVTTSSIVTGDPSPVTSVHQPVSNLYNANNRPMV